MKVKEVLKPVNLLFFRQNLDELNKINGMDLP